MVSTGWQCFPKCWTKLSTIKLPGHLPSLAILICPRENFLIFSCHHVIQAIPVSPSLWVPSKPDSDLQSQIILFLSQSDCQTTLAKFQPDMLEQDLSAQTVLACSSNWSILDHLPKDIKCDCNLQSFCRVPCRVKLSPQIQASQKGQYSFSSANPVWTSELQLATFSWSVADVVLEQNLGAPW